MTITQDRVHRPLGDEVGPQGELLFRLELLLALGPGFRKFLVQFCLVLRLLILAGNAIRRKISLHRHRKVMVVLPGLASHVDRVGLIVERFQSDDGGFVQTSFVQLRVRDHVHKAWRDQRIGDPGNLVGIEFLARLQVSQLPIVRFRLAGELP